MTDSAVPPSGRRKQSGPGLRDRMEAAQAELADVNEQLRSILASVSDCYFTLNPAYRIMDLNEAAARWVGLHGNRMRGVSLWTFCSPAAECSLVIREGMERRCRVRREVMSGLRPDRRLDLLVCPSAQGLSVFFTDVTGQDAAMAALEELSGQVLTLQDEERRRIAEELHDSTAQHLVAAALNLIRLKQYVAPRGGQRVLEEVTTSVEEAARELRAFTYLLHPPGLDKGGLCGTVQAFATGFARRAGLDHLSACRAMLTVLPKKSNVRSFELFKRR